MVDVSVVLVVQFPRVQVVEEAVEIPQLQVVEKIMVLTNTIEEKTVRVETLAVEVEKMRSELFEGERALLANPFAKVKGLITCLINRLQAEAPSEVSHTSCCDEGTSKATGKKEDFEADDAKHSSKLEAAVDGEISTLQLELGVFSERQLQMDTTRADERDQDCEALFRINKQSSNIAGGVDVDEDDLDDDAGLRVVKQMVNVPVVTQRAAAASQDRSTQQHQSAKHFARQAARKNKIEEEREKRRRKAR